MRLIHCPHCGESLPWKAHYCANCGYAVSSRIMPARDDDATVALNKSARINRLHRSSALRPPVFQVIKDELRQEQVVKPAPTVEMHSSSNAPTPLLSIPALDNDRIAQQRIDEWLSETDDDDEMERRATWQKIVTHKTPTVALTPRPGATPAKIAPVTPETPSPSPPAPGLLSPLKAPLFLRESAWGRYRLSSFPRLSAWATVLVILALLLGGAFGIFVSLGQGVPQKAGPGIMSLQVAPASIAIGGIITLRGSHFTPKGEIGLSRDGTIPLLDTDNQAIIHADATGSFRDTVFIDGNWTAGPHTIQAEDARLHKTASFTIQVTAGQALSLRPAHLLLSTKNVNLGSGDQATNASKVVTLWNGGGGLISWRATSTEPWLLFTPQSGLFTSGQQMPIRLAGDRSDLKVGRYKANAIFTSNAGQITLTVQMQVTPLIPGHEPVLQATPGVLSFTASDGGISPSAQIVTISNPGMLPLNWQAASSTSNGARWLSASPLSGVVAKGGSQAVAVSVNSSMLLPGVYYGSITFSSQGRAAVLHSPQTIYISVTITPQCSIQVLPGALTFTAVYLQPAPAAKTIGVGINQGCSTPLNWSAAVSTGSGGSWLTISASRGSTPASPAIGINVAGMKPGTYGGQLLFSSSSGTQTVPVTLIMANPTTPILNSSAALLTISGISGQPVPSPQAIVLSNTGGGTLSWKATATTAVGGAWLSVGPSSGSLGARQVTNLAVKAVILPGMIPNIYNGTITLTGTDGAGHPAAGSPQAIAVTFTVQPPCTIAASVPALTFQGVVGQPAPATQAVKISASGTCTNALNWTASTATTPSGGTWLTATASGTVTLSAPSSTVVGVVLAGLSAGTYSGRVTLAATDSVTHRPVGAVQTVAVTLNVQPACTLQAPSTTAETFSSETGFNPATQTFTLGVTGACSGNVTITPTATTTTGGAWLLVSPSSAVVASGQAATFTVTATATSLAAGPYKGAISLAAVDGGIAITGSPQAISVSLNVLAPPTLTASPAALTFTQATGSSTQSITVANYGGEPLNWSAALAGGAPAYVSISSASSGTLAGGISTTLSITVDTTNVPGGTNTSTSVTISATDPVTNAAVSGSPSTVNIAISTPAPAMQLSSNTLNFITTAGTNPASQSLMLTDSGGNGLTWTIGTPSQAWLSITPASGSGAGTPLFTVNVTGLIAGPYSATVTITPSSGPAVTVMVNLTVN